MSTIEKVSITKIKRGLFVYDLIDQPFDGVYFTVFNKSNSRRLASNRFLYLRHRARHPANSPTPRQSDLEALPQQVNLFQ